MQSQTPTPHSTFSCAGHFRDAASLYAFSRCSISLCCSERSASGRPSALRQPRSRTPELRALRRSSNSSSNWTRLRRDSTCWHRSKTPCAFGHSVFLPREISRCCRGDHLGLTVLCCPLLECSLDTSLRQLDAVLASGGSEWRMSCLRIWAICHLTSHVTALARAHNCKLAL
jgi:hypothetical protein